MTQKICDEAWTSGISLLCFDSHVLVLFGHSDAQRSNVVAVPGSR